MGRVCLGKIVKLHGYLGQMKVRTSFDDDFDISKIDRVFSDNCEEFTVNKIFKVDSGIVIGLNNVDLTIAKSMINKNLYIDRILVENKILIEDLKGSSVSFNNGEIFAKIEDVQDYGAAEVFYLKTLEGKELLFPNVKGVINNFDYQKKLLVLNKEKFDEVSNENWYPNSFS